ALRSLVHVPNNFSQREGSGVGNAMLYRRRASARRWMSSSPGSQNKPGVPITFATSKQAAVYLHRSGAGTLSHRSGHRGLRSQAQDPDGTSMESQYSASAALRHTRASWLCWKPRTKAVALVWHQPAENKSRWVAPIIPARPVQPPEGL